MKKKLLVLTMSAICYELHSSVHLSVDEGIVPNRVLIKLFQLTMNLKKHQKGKCY